jgi:hypothetical protein
VSKAAQSTITAIRVAILSVLSFGPSIVIEQVDSEKLPRPRSVESNLLQNPHHNDPVRH